MAKRVEGVTEKLLACAKEEFLLKGYENASLRSIAQSADSSKGAIYIRYPDKASLFLALVQPTIDEFVDLLIRTQDGFSDLSVEDQAENLQEYSNRSFDIILDYIYDHLETFKLLLECSESRVYSDFIHRIVKQDVACTLRFAQNIDSDAIASGRLDEEFAHITSQAFYTGLFEVILHNMPKENAKKQIDRLRRFFRSGWETILNI